MTIEEYVERLDELVPDGPKDKEAKIIYQIDQIK